MDNISFIQLEKMLYSSIFFFFPPQYLELLDQQLKTKEKKISVISRIFQIHILGEQQMI